MTKSPSRIGKQRERGYALVLSLFVMMTLFGLGFVVLSNTTSDLKEVGAIRSHSSATAIAEAGIAWGIDYMSRTWDFEAVGNFNGPLSTFRPMNSHSSDKICPSGYIKSRPSVFLSQSLSGYVLFRNLVVLSTRHWYHLRRVALVVSSSL